MMSAPDFWTDPAKAQILSTERGQIEQKLTSLDQIGQTLDEINEFILFGLEEGEEFVAEELKTLTTNANRSLQFLETKRMLGGKHDTANAIIAINPGAGGTESQDWADMLLRMYLRFCEKNGWKTEIIDYQKGDEAGIKGVTFSVEGEYCFGYLKAESGVHRLVRISPFDSNKRRHTSFASVYVLPELDDEIHIEINEIDLRIDTYRASGAGGQHVNRTDSAVRITHIPTGIVVQCQNERSQHKNRATALKVLKARLFEDERRKREAEQAITNAEKSEIGWGSQIRSYVLQPYQMVKDLRTKHESGNPTAVLNGDLQAFIDAYLLQFADKS